MFARWVGCFFNFFLFLLVYVRVSLPSCLQFSKSKNEGVTTKIPIKPFTKFGPLVGKSVREVDIPDDCDMRYIWEIQSGI